VIGLPQRVEENIQNRRLLKRGQAVLVAVSGGLDSMTLLHILHELSSRNRWHLTVAHFNHQLRGCSSDADEKLVRQAAAAMKLPFVAGRANVKEFAQKNQNCPLKWPRENCGMIFLRARRGNAKFALLLWRITRTTRWNCSSCASCVARAAKVWPG